MSGLDISAFYSRNLRINKDREEEEGLLRSLFILNNRVLHEGGQQYLKPRSLNQPMGRDLVGEGTLPILRTRLLPSHHINDHSYLYHLSNGKDSRKKPHSVVEIYTNTYSEVFVGIQDRFCQGLCVN